MIRKLICKIRGHSWERRPVVRGWKLNEIVGYCRRCGYEASRLDAATMNRSPPGHLLEQPPEDEIVALYRDGKIDEDQMEALLDETV